MKHYSAIYKYIPTYLVFTLRMNLHKYDDYILPHMSFISVCLFESKLQRNKKKINLNLKLPCAYMHEWIMDYRGERDIQDLY